MSETRQVYNVFLSGPGDVGEHKDAARKAVDEFNLTWAKFLGLQFDVTSFPESFHPGIGAEPQEVIWDQVGDFDVYIGLLWARFGTPTARFASGTSEEFHEAVRRYQSGAVRAVRVYFCQQAMPASIDGNQVAGVQAFQKSVETSALYGTYSSTEEIAAKVRFDLSKIAQKAATVPRAPIPVSAEDQRALQDQLNSLLMHSSALSVSAAGIGDAGQRLDSEINWCMRFIGFMNSVKNASVKGAQRKAVKGLLEAEDAWLGDRLTSAFESFAKNLADAASHVGHLIPQLCGSLVLLSTLERRLGVALFLPGQVQELSNWLDDMSREIRSLPTAFEGVQDLLEGFTAVDALRPAVLRALAEVQTFLAGVPGLVEEIGTTLDVLNMRPNLDSGSDG